MLMCPTVVRYSVMGLGLATLFGNPVSAAEKTIAPPASSAAFSGQDWPCWRGPQHNGISAESLGPLSDPALGYQVLWKASVGKGFSSFAIAGGRAFTLGNADNVDTVFCFDADSGKALWRHSYPCPLTPLSYEGGPSATPAVDGERVYTLSKSGHLFCLNAATGQVVWSKKFDPAPRKEGDYQVDWGYAASPLVLGEKLILSVGWAGMAVDKVSGQTLWDNGPGRPGYSSPVPFLYQGRAAVAMLVARGVVAVEVASGKSLWTIPWRTTWDQNAPDVLISEGKLLVTTGHAVGCALFDIHADTPQEIWRNKNLRSELSSPVLRNGLAYGFDGNQLTCIEWATGQRRWSERGLGRGTLILVGSHLVALGDRGNLAIVEATGEAYRPAGKPQPVLFDRCWTTPAFSGGRIFLRNAMGDVACLKAQVKNPASSAAKSTTTSGKADP